MTNLPIVVWFSLTSVLSGVVEPPQADPPQADKAEPRVLFDGKSLAGWKIANTFDFKRHGAVEVRDGAIQLAKGSPATGVTYDKKPPRDNYEISFEAQRVEGDDFFCGLTFPVAESYCTLILGGWGGTITGLSNVDGNAAIENETTSSVEFKNGKWYRVRLRVTPKKIEAWVDKEQIVELDRKDRSFSIWWEQEPMRPLGIASWYTAAAIRKIELKAIR